MTRLCHCIHVGVSGWRMTRLSHWIRMGVGQLVVRADGQRLVDEAAVALGEVPRQAAVALQHPLGGEQTLHAHGAPGVDAARADAHLVARTEGQGCRLRLIHDEFSINNKS